VIVLAIDPGPKQSAMVVYDSGWPMLVDFRMVDNDEFADALKRGDINAGVEPSHLAIEMIASYGMPVGREVFETALWVGRFIQAWGGPHTLVYRKDVKLHLCNSPRAKDSNIRAALIDRFGGPQSIKKGGRLYGVSKDVWSALAVAVAHSDTTARRVA